LLVRRLHKSASTQWLSIRRPPGTAGFQRQRWAGANALKEETVTKQLRGFATMDVTKQREIARMGGKAAHAKGTAHEWSREQARLAGHKGGLARARRMEPIIAARKKQNQP
jgi:hypothetical protein